MDFEVYDFNKTIYKGNVMLDFYLFSIRRNPLIIRCFFYQLYVFLKYCLDICTETEYKEGLLCFLKGINDLEFEIQTFCLKSQEKIERWYRIKQHSTDVILTSAPEFIVEPFLISYGVFKIIASKVDARTGKYLALSCSGYEKVKRFNDMVLAEQSSDVLSEWTIKNCYLHQLSDEPLALMAEMSYMVSNAQIHPWVDYKLSLRERLEQIFLKKDFIVFLIIGVINTFNGIALAYLYSMLFGANLAFALGYGTSLLISYLLNSWLTFKESLSAVKFIKFSLSYMPNFVIQFVIVLIVYNLLHLPKLLAYALAAIIGVPVTFLVLKVFAFSHKTI